MAAPAAFLRGPRRHPRQPLGSGAQRHLSLAKREANQIPSKLRLRVQPRSRHGRDSDVTHQPVAELDVGGKAERADVGKHVYAPSGSKMLKPAARSASQRMNRRAAYPPTSCM